MYRAIFLLAITVFLSQSTGTQAQETKSAWPFSSPAKSTGGTLSKAPTDAGNPDVVAEMKPGEMLRRTAQGSTATTYHVYVPTTFKAEQPGPIIIGFHPGGNGAGIVNALKPSAEKVGWLLVGCDKLSNKIEFTPEAEKIEDELLTDILDSLPHDSTAIYLAGLSGGAQRCYHLSGRVNFDVAGILAYGGWLGGSEMQRKRYGRRMSVAMINGRSDNNANAWVAGDTAALRRTQCKVKEFPWDGGHAIAPADITDEAIAWFQKERKEK